MSMTKTGLNLIPNSEFRIPNLKGRLREDSQCGKILRVLQDARGEWVSMPALVLISGSYNVHSRIDELRHRHGYEIENETDVSVRPHVSKYRLL